MNRRTALPVVVVLLLAAAAGGAALFRGAPTPPPAVDPPARPVAAAVRPPADPGTGPGAAPPFWALRLGTEALVLSDSAASLEFLDATGRVLGSGRLDPAGAFRGSIPAGAGSLALKFGTGSAAAWRLPDPPDLLRWIHLDRAVLHPGDRFRACIRSAEEAGPPPVLRLDPADPAVPAPPLLSPEVFSFPEASSRWRIWESSIPDDAAPGTAVIESGRETLEIPVAPRFTREDPGESDGGGGSPDTPPGPPDPGAGGGTAGAAFRLERRDGRWWATGPADAGSVLFFAESGGRVLAHQAVLAMDGAASAALPLGDAPPARVRVTAVASTPRGFLETSSGRSGLPARPLGDDPVLSRFLAERPAPDAAPAGPAWVHEGDAPTGLDPAPPARQGYLERRGRAIVKARMETPVLLPEGARVRWTVHPSGIAGSLRIRCDDDIRVETPIAAGRGSGEFPVPDRAIRSILVESDAEGLEHVAFEWAREGRAGDAPAVAGGGLALDRTLPSAGRVGEAMEYRIVIRWTEGSGAAEVVCPIPRGAVLAEDGWSIRSRAPAGTRVETPDGAVICRFPPRDPGEAVLSFRIRLAWPGRFAAPAATAGSARSSSGFLDIE